MKKIFTLSLFVLLSIKSFSFTQVVTVQGTSFSPSSFTINFGDTVKWQWVSGIHTTTSTAVPSGASSWDQNINSGSPTFTYVPVKGGIYSYKCTPHFAMGMTGTFTVLCPNVTAQISAGGPLTFCNGGNVLLSSAVVNANVYQWRKNGNPINNATSSTYKAKTTGSYTLLASNACGANAVSNALSVTVNSIPAATITPTDTVIICPGDSIKLKANIGTSLAYQWLKGGVAINGATTNKYFAKQTANYKVVVTKTTTGCSKTSAITRVVVGCRNADEKTESGTPVSIYPNPSAGNFSISFPEFQEGNYSILVYDGLGKRIITQQVDVRNAQFGSELKEGIYIVEIKKGNQLISRQRIIKVS